jgi:hypothetical protein
MAITAENLYGKWHGKLLQLDWSGKHIEKSISLALEFKQDRLNGNMQYTWSVNSEEKTGNTALIDAAFFFENLELTLPHTSHHKEEENSLEHVFLSSALSAKNIGGTMYLIGTIESYIPKWKETSAPMRFVVAKEGVATENNIEISEAILGALTAQERSFIKLYPNPFISDLIIAYTLKEAGSISVQLTSIDGTENFTIAKGAQQKAGDYRYHFEGGQLKKGVYVISVFVNGVKKTKLIVKK